MSCIEGKALVLLTYENLELPLVVAILKRGLPPLTPPAMPLGDSFLNLF